MLIKEKNIKKVKILSWILFSLYLIVLVYFLFFAEAFGRSFSGREYHYNLVPFKEITRFLNYRESLGIGSVMLNLVGNIAGFIPFGYFLPIISIKCRGFAKILFLGIDFSLAVEVIQLIFKVGSFDVDDIILNTLGVIIGFVLYSLSDKLRKKYYV